MGLCYIFTSIRQVKTWFVPASYYIWLPSINWASQQHDHKNTNHDDQLLPQETKCLNNKDNKPDPHHNKIQSHERNIIT